MNSADLHNKRRGSGGNGAGEPRSAGQRQILQSELRKRRSSFDLTDRRESQLRDEIAIYRPIALRFIDSSCK